MRVNYTIRDEAAFALCPGSREDGIAELNRLIASISKNIRVLDVIFKLSLVVMGIFAGLSALWLILNDKTLKPQLFMWILCVFSVGAIGALVIIWQKIQHNGFGHTLLKLQEVLIPTSLQKLIWEYANDAKRACSKSGTVPSGLFASHWAILLFSEDAEIRGWVRSNKGKRESKEIYIVSYHAQKPLSNQFLSANPEAEKPIEPEDSSAAHKYFLVDGQTNLNENPEHQWLVGGSRAEYEISRDQALANEPPLIREWKSFVLDGGRYELRRGGQARSVGTAIREIQSGLKMQFGNDLSPNQKPSDSQIKRMLSAGKANASLRSHFYR